MRKKQEKEYSLKREILSWGVSLLTALAVAMLLKTFVFGMIRVDGTSMMTTLRDRDRMYVSILTARIAGYERGDVVICRYPGADHRCVKRIIGLPGETVSVDQGVVYVNGEPLEEEYVVYSDMRSMEEMQLADGEYFVLGDNRPMSKDSRDPSVGAVTEVIGKVRWIIWPPSRMGKVE